MLFAPGLAVMVPPPHAPVKPLPAIGISRPVGSVSVNPIPVSVWLGFGLLSVKVNVVVPFTGTAGAPNALVMVGGAITLRAAEAALPMPPLLDTIALVVLVKSPATIPVTLTLTVQEAAAPSVIPETLMLVAPAVAVIVPVVQVPVRPGEFATTIPAGRLSVNPIPTSGSGFTAGFVIVKVTVVLPFSAILDAPKALPMVGGARTTTNTVAAAVFPEPPSLDVTAVVALSCSPAAMPATFTLKVQDALAARVAPDRDTLVAPSATVMVPPPHDPVRLLGVPKTSPAGRLSVKPIPVSGMVFAAGLVIVKLRLVMPFRGM